MPEDRAAGSEKSLNPTGGNSNEKSNTVGDKKKKARARRKQQQLRKKQNQADAKREKCGVPCMASYHITLENRRTGVCEMQKGLEKWTTNLGLGLLIIHIKNLTYIPDAHFITPYTEPVPVNNPPDAADMARIEGYKIHHRAVVGMKVKLQEQY